MVGRDARCGRAAAARPSGPVVLTVTGAIAAAKAGDGAVFDLEMLQDLPRRTIRTTTIWTEGEPELTGVPLAALLDRLGVTSGQLTATAVKDYAVRIPVADAVPDVAAIPAGQTG